MMKPTVHDLFFISWAKNERKSAGETREGKNVGALNHNHGDSSQ